MDAGGQDSSQSTIHPQAGGDFAAPSICDLARASTLLVEASIDSVGTVESAPAAGLSTIRTQTLYYDPGILVVPVTLDVMKTIYAAPSVDSTSGAPLPRVLPILFQGERAPYGVDGEPVSSGYFFLTRYDGHWVDLVGGFFTWDSATGLLTDGDKYVLSQEISEPNLVSQAVEARASTTPCEVAGCPNSGGIMPPDGGWCLYPDAGPMPFLDGGQRGGG